MLCDLALVLAKAAAILLVEGGGSAERCNAKLSRFSIGKPNTPLSDSNGNMKWQGMKHTKPHHRPVACTYP